jgi:hypothetical protein
MNILPAPAVPSPAPHQLSIAYASTDVGGAPDCARQTGQPAVGGRQRRRRRA